jgi:hypothetical protein
MTGPWEVMVSESPFLFSVAFLVIPPRLISISQIHSDNGRNTYVLHLLHCWSFAAVKLVESIVHATVLEQRTGRAPLKLPRCSFQGLPHLIVEPSQICQNRLAV